MLSCRKQLEKVQSQPSTHAGLWLDKYLKEQAESSGENAKKAHFEQIANKPISDVYDIFFERWQKFLEQINAVTRKAQVDGRLVVGLGGESVLETAVTLHHTYGVPCIPGSALKGLAAYYARNRLEQETWGEESDAYKILFGNTTESGYITFFDALYIPHTAKENCPLSLDIITVHHPEYYHGEDSPPADWDSPTPIPFLSTTGSYLLALHGDEKWVGAAFEILAYALRDEGIGAKTSSGYGRMAFGDISSKSKRRKSNPVIKSVTETISMPQSFPRKTAQGKVKYDRGRAFIITEDGRRFSCNWKRMGMDALKGKTTVEFEYEVLPNSKLRVVAVRKKW